MKKIKFVFIGIIGIVSFLIFWEYRQIKKTNHYQNWLYWCEECKNNNDSMFKKILVLFKIIYPPSFMMTIMDLNLDESENVRS